MMELVTPQNVIGAIMTGVFGLMWWDVRKIRGEFHDTGKEIEKKLRHKLDANTHELICKNSGLLVAAMVEVKLKERHEEDKREMKEMKEELLKAINKAGGSRG